VFLTQDQICDHTYSPRRLLCHLPWVLGLSYISSSSDDSRDPASVDFFLSTDLEPLAVLNSSIFACSNKTMGRYFQSYEGINLSAACSALVGDGTA
jgi:hypothetical protein